MSDNLIQASEIGEYVYCNRAWWLNRIEQAQSVNHEAMMRGQRFHVAHREMVEKSNKTRRNAYVFMVPALLLLMYWFVTGL